ncbi:MAG: hypothetical protein BGO76_06935 [Caedibacter sp. 38-128]|nr:hypothetical protein [Holosporales bacterium]OJX04748.1 MAG: hypothetical protein BGO76_06935 [Caedibacter sp. 38-128]
MTYFHTFRKGFWILILMITHQELSYACDQVKSENNTKILALSVAGAQQFAEKFEECIKLFPNTLLLTDGDGVYTRHSQPMSDLVCPRGDMPAYLDYLQETRRIPMILTSAWDKPSETFNRVKLHHLETTFNLQLTCEEKTEKFGNDEYHYVKNGNVISVKKILPFKASTYFRQKAFAPLFVLGEDYSCDQVIFIDDSESNRDIFAKEIISTPLYPKLQRIVIISIPEIYGQILETDIISEKYLPLSYKEKWSDLWKEETLSLSKMEPAKNEDSLLKCSLNSCSFEEALHKTTSSFLKSSEDETIVEGTS